MSLYAVMVCEWTAWLEFIEVRRNFFTEELGVFREPGQRKPWKSNSMSVRAREDEVGTVPSPPNFKKQAHVV
jgi:hypothetical protein